MTALDTRHRDRQAAIQREVSSVLATVLNALPTLSQDDLERYVRIAHPTIAGGQLKSADVASAYVQLAAQTARAPRARRAVDNARALKRSGVIVTADSPTLVSPVLRARRLVNEGQSMTSALAAAASYAGALASTDLLAAQRVGMDEGAQSSGAAIVGYRKELSSDPCDWCTEAADNVYDTPDEVPFHERDRCSVAPVMEGE